MLTPSAYAQELRYDLSLGLAPVEPERICRLLGFRYIEADLGASGREMGALLIGKSGRLAVVVNLNIGYPARRRFTAAHELGHASIPWHFNSEYWCTANDIESYHATRKVEREANEFAAELLLPERVVREHLRRRVASMDLAREIADAYGISLMASACRIVTLAADCCAVIKSAPDGIAWIFQSQAMYRLYTMRSRGSPLAYGSLSARWLGEGSVPSGPERVPTEAWISGSLNDPPPFLIEEVAPGPGYVLGFVTVPTGDGGQEEGA